MLLPRGAFENKRKLREWVRVMGMCAGGAGANHTYVPPISLLGRSLSGKTCHKSGCKWQCFIEAHGLGLL